jgi:hypothetical protein
MQNLVQKRRKELGDSSLISEETKAKHRIICKFHVLAMKIRNNSPEEDPNLDVSILFLCLGLPCAVLYAFFRAYILVEDIVSIRALPTDAYSTVSWTAFVPYIG